MIVNKVQLADIFAVSLPTIEAWVRDGMPHMDRRGREWQFDTRPCIDWLILKKAEGKRTEEAESFEAARARERAAVATLRELELAKTQGELVPIADVVSKIEEEYGVVKSRLRAMPGRMAQALAAETDVAAVERRLRDEIDDTLKTLSND